MFSPLVYYCRQEYRPIKCVLQVNAKPGSEDVVRYEPCIIWSAVSKWIARTTTLVQTFGGPVSLSIGLILEERLVSLRSRPKQGFSLWKLTLHIPSVSGVPLLGKQSSEFQWEQNNLRRGGTRENNKSTNSCRAVSQMIGWVTARLTPNA